MAGLLKRSTSATLWGSAGSAARIVLQIAVQIVLARILGPDQYGVFAMGIVVLSLGAFFSDFGIAYGLIQKNTVTTADVKFVISWQLILGAAVSASIFLLSNLATAFFAEPRLESVLQVLAVSCLLNAITAPSINLLKRNLDFRTIQISQLASYFVGYVLVGIPLALTGHELWALVYAWLTQIVVNLVLVYSRSRHPIGFLLYHDDTRQMTSYGLTVLVTNCVNWILGNVDRLIVARVFASTGVGLYATSYNLVNNPTITLLGVLQPALLSTAAKLEGDRERLRRAFLTVAAAVALVVMPFFAGIAVMAEPLVLTLYGSAWEAAAAPLQALALAMPFYIMVGVATPILWASGRTRTEFTLQVPLAVIWTAACWLAAQHSMEAVAWTVFALFMLRSAVLLMAATRALSLQPIDLIRAVRGGVITASIASALLLSVDYLIQQSAVAPSLRLAIDLVVGGIGSIVALITARALIVPEVFTLIESVSSCLPRPLARAQCWFVAKALK